MSGALEATLAEASGYTEEDARAGGAQLEVTVRARLEAVGGDPRMTVRPIRYLGDPVLRRPAKAVLEVNDAIRLLIADMIESMHVAQGVGLAAPQIGVGLQVVVLGMPEEEPFALVNPRVIGQSGSRLMEAEGCLSVPGYRGVLNRSMMVTVQALDELGQPMEITATDNLLAEALEHEMDHLNGILYVDHVPDLSKLQKLRGTGWVDEDGAAGSPVPEAAAAGTDRG